MVKVIKIKPDIFESKDKSDKSDFSLYMPVITSTLYSIIGGLGGYYLGFLAHFPLLILLCFTSISALSIGIITLSLYVDMRFKKR